MNRELLEIYNRELRILRENAKEFAEEFPGVADRLGGLLDNNMDPMIRGLLEGTAYLASRVQLKLKHEYEQFTNNLLEQLVPDYLAPTPAAALLQFEPLWSDTTLKDGLQISAGSYVEARFIERQRRIACKFRLAGGTVLWPLEIAEADYIPTQAALQGLGVEATAHTHAGFRLSLLRRSVARREDEPNNKQVAKKPESWIANCRTNELTFHITCPEGDAARIYEKIVAHQVGVYLRHFNEFGDPIVTALPANSIEQIGFSEEEALFPTEKRVFTGFELLREFYVLPAKFLAFKVKGLRHLLSAINTNRMDLIIALDQPDTRLVPVVKREAFSLYVVPAANMFEMTLARVVVKQSDHEYHIVTDRSRHLDFELLRIIRADAHFPGTSEKQEVKPLYAGPPLGTSKNKTRYFTLRRLPRRRSQEERRFAQVSTYIGTDSFLTLVNDGQGQSGLGASEISLRGWCSNRHLTENLPVGQGGADFILEDRTNMKVSCILGPTAPRDAVTMSVNPTGQDPHSTAAWRLINMLSLNHLGVANRGASDSAAALRELLSLFANLSDAPTERRLSGIKSVESRPINRRVRHKSGTGVVRGLAIAVTLDEKAFEGSGILLFGAILDRFFMEYVGINSVVQTEIISTERGSVYRWPVRMGKKVEL